MRVSQIQLTQVGPFDQVELTIPEPAGQGEIILFEGPNGSGKTTLVQGLCALLEQFFFGTISLAPTWALGSQSRNTTVARLRGDNGDVEATFGGLEQEHSSTRLSIVKSGPPPRIEQRPGASLAQKSWLAFNNLNEKISWAPFAYHGALATPDLSSSGPRDLRLNPFEDALSFGEHSTFKGNIGHILTNIESARTKAIVYARERAGPGQRAALEARAKAQADSLQRMQDALSQVLGWAVRFDFDIDHQAPRVLFDGEPIPLEHLGEGLRRTFSWLIDLLARLELVPWEDTSRSPFDQEFLLFLDEVDQSLHPTMQMRLMPALRGLFPRARIYATTHSPFVVASVEDGYVFPIRPDPKTHRVSGVIEPQRLSGGRSLEAVVDEVFDAPSTFIDPKTRGELAAHKQAVEQLRARGSIDWGSFLEHRRTLRGLGEEVWTVAAMREVPVRKQIEEKLREAGE